MRRFNVIIIVLMVMPIFLFSQSVEEFIQMAKENNPELKSLKLEYEAALLKEQQVMDWPDPVVNLGVGVLPIETRLGAQRLKIGVSQMIPWKGLLEAQGELAITNAEVKAQKDELKEINIEFLLRSSYSLLQNLDRQEGIINQKLLVLDVLEELAKSSLRSGSGRLSNVLLVERQRTALTSDLALLAKKKEQPTITINRWAGRSLNKEINLEEKGPILISKEELVEFIQSEHPNLKILDRQIIASKAKSDLTKFQSKPKIGVGLDYALIANRPNIELQDNGRDVLMPMGSISIPLHTDRYKAIRQEEKLNQAAIIEQKKELTEGFYAEIKLAFSIIDFQEQTMDKYKSLKEITQETINLLRSEYASEGRRFEELLRLEMEQIEYDQMIITANYEKDLAIAKLLKFKK